MNIKNLIENDLLNLWENNKSKFGNYPLYSVDEVPENAVIFIGLNPSLSEKDRAERIEQTENKHFFYSNTNQEHKYFARFIEIADKVGAEWGHIDLLYMQETQQKKINDLRTQKEGIVFLCDQLQISKKVIEEIISTANPQLFVVNNTLARRFLGKDRIGDTDIWMGLDFGKEIDKEIGTYRYKNIPFFFTSMLTGQRALDNGSFERLIWQIEFVLNKEKSKNK
jgi:hypothetical protein